MIVLLRRACVGRDFGADEPWAVLSAGSRAGGGGNLDAGQTRAALLARVATVSL